MAPSIPRTRETGARSSTFGLAVLTALLLVAASSAFAFNPPPFPRIAGIDIAITPNPGDPRYDDPAYQAQLATQSVIILGMFPGIAPGGHSMQSVVQGIKNNNPNALVFLYVNENQMRPESTWDTVRAQVNTNKWYVYDGKGTASSDIVTSGLPFINNTPFSAKFSGSDSVTYLTNYFYTNYYQNIPNSDGFFMDNMFVSPTVSADWENTGTVLQNTDPRAASDLRSGYKEYVTQIRSLMPTTTFQIGNIGDWTAIKASNGNLAEPGQHDIPADYQNLVDGGVLEQFIGGTSAIESWAGWTAVWNAYHKTMAAVRAPKLVIFNQHGDPTDYQAFRYGLATCLMDDGYYSFTDQSKGYQGVIPFDEYTANLGTAISAPPAGPWQNGIWRRDYQNGIALVNPKGNGVQTVTLEANFLKLKGTQDPSVNNGATTRSVTLQDRDGIILLRTTHTFGRATIATSTSSGMNADAKRASPFTLSENGTLAQFSAYLDGNGGASGTQAVRVVLYRDSSGVPGAKVVESSTMSITAGMAPQWITFSTPQIQLTPGTYWIALQTGGTQGVARNYGDGSTTGNWYSNADLFADGASDPFGAGNVGSSVLSVYATYVPGTTTAKFGRTSIATTTSSGMSADFKRGSPAQLSQAGTLAGFSAYLDGNAGASGSQDVRVVLYRDANGVPGSKVVESSTSTVTAGMAPQWVNFSAPPTTLSPGTYWLVLHTGATQGVARNYGDGSMTGNWYSNADVFSDGASDPFGSGIVGSVVLSVYATYAH